MSKELEKVKSILDEYIKAGRTQKHYLDLSAEDTLKELMIIKGVITEYEAIDNSNPGEALECLDNFIDECQTEMYNYAEMQNGYQYERYQYRKEQLENIKQALLKAQEPKQYLKWEDLEFSFKDKYMKVKLNGNIYALRYTKNTLMEFPVAYLEFDNTEITIIDCKKQFFNDLHLEMVEEE